jgi:hypothetical protein
MKLYTEEQVEEMINLCQATGLNSEYLLSLHTPIELPSDEEITDRALKVGYTNNLFTLGAKWMRDKIEGGNR